MTDRLTIDDWDPPFPFDAERIRPKDEDYWQRCRELTERVASQQAAVQQAADWFADAILAQRLVHLFGGGHSRILVEEMWPRYGSFPASIRSSNCR